MMLGRIVVVVVVGNAVGGVRRRRRSRKWCVMDDSAKATPILGLLACGCWVARSQGKRWSGMIGWNTLVCREIRINVSIVRRNLDPYFMRNGIMSGVESHVQFNIVTLKNYD
jgi:hypothetical protein